MPTKKQGWREAQSRTKKNKRNKLALGILGLVIGLFIISFSVRFTQNLFNPFTNTTAGIKKYIWNGKFSLNLLIRTDHISLFSYNPQEEKIVIINVPDETFLEVPYGFGKWQLRSVYELGQSQKGSSGNQLLADTLTSFFAVPIDGFLDLSQVKNKKNAFELIEGLRSNLFSGFDLLPVLRTNLTAWELMKIKLGISSVRFDKIKQINLDKLNVLDQENLLDGTPILTADPVSLDSILSDLADPQITAEHKNIAVLNATDHPQLALKWARLITNLGGNVIITANAKERLEKTKIVGEQSMTLTRLQQIFALSDKISSSGEQEAYQRAQITVLLGEDYFDK